VYILDLSGSVVEKYHKISSTQGSFDGVLNDRDQFGVSVANIGDIDGDGITDLAVGADRDEDGGFGNGAVWILFLRSDANVKAYQKISATSGGFDGVLDGAPGFGICITSSGDLNGDSVNDIVVGARSTPLRSPGAGAGDILSQGAVWVLFLETDGTSAAGPPHKIGGESEIFDGVLEAFDYFGTSCALIKSDPGSDNPAVVAVGSLLDDDGGEYSLLPAVHRLFISTCQPLPTNTSSFSLAFNNY
jgi:hypothetical protein